MTLAELLTAAGYGYRASRIYGRREVYRIADGAIMGQMTAAGAVAFLEGLE
jgi:hypothetical protein